jgi:hypothetical protein
MRLLSVGSLVLLCWAALLGKVEGVTRYVNNVTGSDLNDGTSSSNAYASTQAAVNDPAITNTTAPHTILVKATATPYSSVAIRTVAIPAGKGGNSAANMMEIRSIDGRAVVNAGTSEGFYLNGANYTKIKGFLVRRSDQNGNGIYVTASHVILEDCVVSGFYQGITLGYGTTTGVKVLKCAAYGGRQLIVVVDPANGGEVSLEGCMLYRGHNSQADLRAIVQPAANRVKVNVKNCVFYGGYSGYAGVHPYYASGGRVNVNAKNSIVVQYTVGGVKTGLFNLSPNTITSTYNNVWGNTTNYTGCIAGAGDISSNPLFVSEAATNFHLQATSPCLGAGEGGVDMGAYPVAEPQSLTAVRDGKTVSLQWTKSAWGQVSGYRIYRSQNSYVNYTQIGSVGSSTLTFDDSENKPVGIYYYYVESHKTGSDLTYSTSPVEKFVAASGTVISLR